MNYRNSIKAIIIENNRILTMSAIGEKETYYILPGGGMEPGESMHEALKRECMEEISCEVEIGELQYIREYRSQKHEFAHINPNIHQIEFAFLCTLKEGSIPRIGSIPDKNQSGIVWLDLKRIMDYPFYPLSLRQVVADLTNKNKVYFGDCN